MMKRQVSIWTGRVVAVLFAIVVMGLWGCASTSEPAPPPIPTGSEFDQGAPPPAPEPSGPDVLDLDAVYFEFDRAEIRNDARSVLRGNADSLKQNDHRVTIEGHCDERGDEEYNLALGERRASAVKRYLVNLGISSSQLSTLSYGESKPAATGHSESAWRWNRRAEFRSGR